MGDFIKTGDGQLFKVLAVESDTVITIRPIRWYDFLFGFITRMFWKVQTFKNWLFEKL